MESQGAEQSQTSATDNPAEGSSKKERTKIKECPVCRKRLSSSYNKTLCGGCMNRVLEDQGPSFIRNMRDMVRQEIRASLPSRPTSSETPGVSINPPPDSQPLVIAGPSQQMDPSPINEEDQDLSLEVDDQGELASDPEEISGEDSAGSLLPIESIDALIKNVRLTMEIDDTPQPRSVQDIMFEGLAPKKRLVFPVHQSIKTLICHEWANPDRKFFIPRAYKRKYPFGQEDCESWEGAPKIDHPVAKISKKNALPFEDTAVLKDPLDKRADIYLKKSWEASTSAFKPLIATTSVARSLKMWMTELKDKVKESNPNQDFNQAFTTIDNAVSFISEASADALKLSARSAALSNSARRSIWVKEWKGDTTSKAKLCGVPCEGKLLFGSALESILEKASDRKKGFPLIPQQTSRPFRGRDFKIPVLVGATGTSRQGPSMEHHGSKDYYNRRQSFWMGGSYGTSSSTREMEPGRSQRIPKRTGVKGSFSLFNTGTTRASGEKRKGTVGQRGGSSLPKSPRWNQINRPDEDHTPYLQQEQAKTRRMGAIPGGFPSNLQSLGDPESRPVRHQDEQKSKRILFPVSEGQPRCHRRTSTELGQRPPLRLPTDQASISGNTQDQAGQSRRHSGCSLLAQKGVVRLVEETVDSRPLGASGETGSPTPGTSTSPDSTEPSLNSLACERQLLIDRGLSPQVISTLLASRKRVTSAIYLRTWKAFCRYVNQPINVIAPPNIPLILDFLQEGLNMNLRPSTIKVQISALSALFDFRLAEHPWVKRFTKAATRLAPSIKSRLPPWDLNIVLSGLTISPFEPMLELPIRLLSWKLAFLLAITSARRVSEIRAFSINPPYMTIRDDRIILSPDPAFLPKVVSNFHRSQEVVLPSFCTNPSNDREAAFHTLDVRRILLHYLEVTRDWRQTDNLLVSFQGKNKGKAATSQTIARWVKQAIGECYRSSGKDIPVGFGAHSTRAVATSWAERASVTLEQICRTATWSTPHTFFRHYRLQLSSTEDLTFGRRVLHAVVPP
ncbi:uncharacterized protein [Dendropsophus ebraccatus]|uniref:uncharacterized protein isoform X1 n=1 Tax=Dendropsophus ebraccatus TaxID=150705 RepID=UPI003831C8AF